MGMLSSAVYVLAMDTFGPIADNAGGIVEMSDQPEMAHTIWHMHTYIYIHIYAYTRIPARDGK